MRLVDELLKGDKRAAAKIISLVEDEDAKSSEALAALYPHTGRAHVVGFTGPPGAGKSSLINRLVRDYRAREKRVGVVAVDPTSPFTGGAVLGDRIRMADTGTDEGVFIRSMATRGYPGGLALATFDAVKVLDAWGADVVFVETVGAGQSEVEIASRAHTTVVVEMAASGDAVQALKAGILEIGDIYAVNKTDQGGADAMVSNLRFVVERRKEWMPPVVPTSALEGTGTSELAKALERHWAYLKTSGELQVRERERARKELFEALRRALAAKIETTDASSRKAEALVESIAARKTDPRGAAATLLRALRVR